MVQTRLSVRDLRSSSLRWCLISSLDPKSRLFCPNSYLLFLWRLCETVLKPVCTCLKVRCVCHAGTHHCRWICHYTSDYAVVYSFALLSRKVAPSWHVLFDLISPFYLLTPLAYFTLCTVLSHQIYSGVTDSCHAGSYHFQRFWHAGLRRFRRICHIRLQVLWDFVKLPVAF